MKGDGSSSSSSSNDGGAMLGRDRQWLNFTLPEMTVLVSSAGAAQQQRHALLYFIKGLR
jgi:hypothetical protein